MTRTYIDDEKTVFSASTLTQLGSITCQTEGHWPVGNRILDWRRDAVCISISHRSTDGQPLTYTVALLPTLLPSKGIRLWFACPDCARRCDDLFLLNDRDRLTCRKCCGLKYRSAFKKRYVRRSRRRKKRPDIHAVYDRME